MTPWHSDTTTEGQTTRQARNRLRGPAESLSAQLLALTVTFVLLVEALVLLPDLAAFRQDWLTQRHESADIAVIALKAAPEASVSPAMRTALLRAANAETIMIGRNGRDEIVLGAPMAPNGEIERVTRIVTLGRSLRDTLGTVFARPGAKIAVTGPTRVPGADSLTVVVREAPLRQAMLQHALGLLGISLVLAVLTGALVFAAMGAGFVAPMRKLTAAIERFRANPQDEAHRFRPSGRRDEIGRAEDALADMEDALRGALSQRERLATLGEAVSRITHDLRNSLAAAQMVSDRLAASSDPSVRAATPRLERALERAISLAESTLRFGKAEETAPEPEPINVRQALDDAADEALAPFPGVGWANAVRDDIIASADPDHFHRLASNLIRNAAQAMTSRGTADPVIRGDAPVAPDGVRVTITDNGPGIPEPLRRSLFLPFSSGDRTGTGLGLAIARDLARRNGGDVLLAATGPTGTQFEIRLRAAAPYA